MHTDAHVNRASAWSCTDGGDALRSERVRLGLSQEQFAERGGVSRRSQINWEKGEAWPTGEYLAQIGAMGVDVAFVLTGVRRPTVAESLETTEAHLVEIFRGLTDAGRSALIGIAEQLVPGSR